MSAATFWPNTKPFELLKKQGLSIALVAVFLSIPAYAIYKSGDKQFKAQESLVEEYLVADASAQLVIADGLTTYGHAYFYDFTEVEDEYMWFSELDEPILDRYRSDPVKSVYLLINEAYFNAEYDDESNLEKFISRLDIDLDAQLVASKGAVKLIKVK